MSFYPSRTCFDKVSSVKNPNCPVCNVHLKTIAKILPYAHCSVSKLICAHSREPINESNPPLMLPNGYVYSSKVNHSIALFPFCFARINNDRCLSTLIRLYKQWLQKTTAEWHVHEQKRHTNWVRRKKCTSCNEKNYE